VNVDAVLTAAQALLLERGFDATSMAHVRQRAGVSNGSLFHHFPTKVELVRAVYARALRDYHATVLGALAPGVTAQQGVEGMVERHVTWVLKRRAQARVLSELRSFTFTPGETPVWADPNRDAFTTLRRWVAAHVAAGAMQALPFEVWLALVFAPVLQLTSGWARASRPVVPKAVRAALAHAAWEAVRTKRRS
jgi:AcrR family transcriptional regulator